MNKNDDNSKKAPCMSRTKNQLATVYSPGSLITFEDNLVICRSIPMKSYSSTTVLNQYAEDQIFNSIKERVAAWYEVAISIGSPVEPYMCVDKDLLNNDKTDVCSDLNRRLFGFVTPSNVGYEPDILTIECRECHLIKTFDNTRKMFSEISANTLNGSCEKSKTQKHLWRQLDIVFVHPNGEIQPPKPWKNEVGADGKPVRYDYCKTCGEKDVRLNSSSSQIGKRFFYCAGCSTRRDPTWLQNSEEYIRESKRNTGLSMPHVRMKPVSSRASIVFYPQQDMIIDFGDSSSLSSVNNQHTIEAYIIDKYNLSGPKLSDDEIKDIVVDKKGEKEWIDYIELKSTLSRLSSNMPKIAIDSIKSRLEDIEKAWHGENLFSSNVVLPETLRSNIRLRNEIFATKYNPFKLLAEHDALLDKCVNSKLLPTGLRSFTPLDDLDDDIGPGKSEDRIHFNNRHRKLLDSIGLKSLGLIRNFKTINYTFGFTRVASTPKVDYIKNTTVPVRMKLFPKTMVDDSLKHPIYTLKQENEAIYVQLDESIVRKWLEEIDTEEGVDSSPIGLQYVTNAAAMSLYLDTLPRTDQANGIVHPKFSLALYTLLHTLSHHIMLSISEYSGLSVSSLGEYIFPADLAFVVYRKAMTMDLGNLNSMLRNNTPAFLEHIAQVRNLGCGSGSLCLYRGGGLS